MAKYKPMTLVLEKYNFNLNNHKISNKVNVYCDGVNKETLFMEIDNKKVQYIKLDDLKTYFRWKGFTFVDNFYEYSYDFETFKEMLTKWNGNNIDPFILAIPSFK